MRFIGTDFVGGAKAGASAAFLPGSAKFIGAHLIYGRARMIGWSAFLDVGDVIEQVKSRSPFPKEMGTRQCLLVRMPMERRDT